MAQTPSVKKRRPKEQSSKRSTVTPRGFGSSIGDCALYDPNERTFHVPLPCGSSIAVSGADVPPDAIRMFSENHVTAFRQMFQYAALNIAHASSKTGSLEPSTDKSHLHFVNSLPQQQLPVVPPKRPRGRPRLVSRPQSASLRRQTPVTAVSADRQFSSAILSPAIDACIGRHPIAVHKQKVAIQKRERPKSMYTCRSKTLNKKSRRGIAPESSDEWPSADLQEFGRISLPVRQSERRIRHELLQNAAFDDDLGVGLKDDENQRRAWHRPRVWTKKVVAHRWKNGHCMFNVQQTAGNKEWLEDSEVDEALKNAYTNESGAILTPPAPVVGMRSMPSGGTRGRKRRFARPAVISTSETDTALAPVAQLSLAHLRELELVGLALYEDSSETTDARNRDLVDF